MIKSFFLRKLTAFKKAAPDFCEYCWLIRTVYPNTAYLILGASITYAWCKIFDIFSTALGIRMQINSIDSTVSSFCISMLCTILAFIFNNFFLILFLGFLPIMTIILNFITNRKKQARFPVIGNPGKDNVIILLALFKIRCLEIARLYTSLLRLQDLALKSDWKELFLAEYFKKFHNYIDEQTLEQQKLQDSEAASRLIKAKFDFSLFYNPDLNMKLRNLEVAFKLEYNIYQSKALAATQTFGLLNNTISALNKEYKRFNSGSTAMFIYDKPLFKPLNLKILHSDATITEIWEEIILALRAALMGLQLKQDTSFDTEKILNEINMLSNLQRGVKIRWNMELENLAEQNSFYKISSEENAFIIEQINNNPINELLRENNIA